MNQQGVFVAGILKGIRPRMWDGKIQGYELGVSCAVNDGFGGVAEKVEIVRVNETHYEAVNNACNKLRGKSVLVQVSVGAFATKGGATSQLNYAPDSQIICLDEVDPFTGELNKSPTKAA